MRNELILYDVKRKRFIIKSLIYITLSLINKIVFYRLIEIDRISKKMLIDLLFNIFFKLNNS